MHVVGIARSDMVSNQMRSYQIHSNDNTFSNPICGRILESVVNLKTNYKVTKTNYNHVSNN